MYTAENITNIKGAGKLNDYIDHERKLIAALENAEIKFDEQGAHTVSFAHLYGRYDIDVETAEPAAIAWVSYGDWNGRWVLSSFDNDQSRGLAYARAALRNKLTEDGKKVLSEARQRLSALEAAA